MCNFSSVGHSLVKIDFYEPPLDVNVVCEWPLAGVGPNDDLG